MIDLRGKTYLVTGASSGIGRATAETISAAGGNVILTARNIEGLRETSSHLNTSNKIFAADLSSEEGINGLVSSIGPIDGFVHCAGIISPYPIKFLRSKHISEIFNINFNSAVLLSSSLLKEKKIKENASIVFISSISSQFPYAGGALYSASKAALESFARTLALEAAGKKIRVNTLAPALVRTKILQASEEMYSGEQMDKIENQYPLGIGRPEDVANAATFLLSDMSSWITGTTINLDGGLLLHQTKHT
jgi:NAD(P)-dependent dehydrogenase (short-subunit alcohol dehydrogenase family)